MSFFSCQKHFITIIDFAIIYRASVALTFLPHMVTTIRTQYKNPVKESSKRIQKQNLVRIEGVLLSA